MADLYEAAREATAHENAIASLVEETHLPVDIVRSVYEHALIELEPTARVKDYLVVLAVRRTREALRSTGA